MTPEEEIEFENEMVEENAERLEDLAMALCHYDPELAVRALSDALESLVDHMDHICDDCRRQENN